MNHQPDRNRAGCINNIHVHIVAQTPRGYTSPTGPREMQYLTKRTHTYNGIANRGNVTAIGLRRMEMLKVRKVILKLPTEWSMVLVAKKHTFIDRHAKSC